LILRKISKRERERIKMSSSSSRKRKRTAQEVIASSKDAEDQRMDIEMGTDDSEALTRKVQKLIEKKQNELVKKEKKKYLGEQVMPLDHDMEMAYKTMAVPGAAKDDTKYYRDGVFHEDEQKAKTMVSFCYKN
jgi:hypothetical protein